LLLTLLPFKNLPSSSSEAKDQRHIRSFVHLASPSVQVVRFGAARRSFYSIVYIPAVDFPTPQ
jgi:hypothetical protein